MEMNLATLITLLGCTFAIIASMFTMFFWVRSEANEDRRNINAHQREDRKDLLQISRNIENVILTIQNEMKDFHGRLCGFEERNKAK